MITLPLGFIIALALGGVATVIVGGGEPDLSLSGLGVTVGGSLNHSCLWFENPFQHPLCRVL